MAGYVDLYVLPVPRKNLKAYQRIANKFGEIIRDHGALEYREFSAAGKPVIKGMLPVEKLLKPKKGEVLVFSVVGFKSRAQRDRGNAAAMKDPRMKAMMEMKPLFDMKRMFASQFETFVGG